MEVKGSSARCSVCGGPVQVLDQITGELERFRFVICSAGCETPEPTPITIQSNRGRKH